MAIGVNARTAFSLLFPQILDEFGWDRGVTAGAFSFGFLIQPPSGSPSRSPKHSHGMRHRAISSVTATPRMAPRSPGGGTPWAFATGRSRHAHQMVVRIGGRRMYLWRAVDHEGEVLDMLVQSRRDSPAALRLMRNLLKKQGFTPKLLVTDKLRSSASTFR